MNPQAAGDFPRITSSMYGSAPVDSRTGEFCSSNAGIVTTEDQPHVLSCGPLFQMCLVNSPEVRGAFALVNGEAVLRMGTHDEIEKLSERFIQSVEYAMLSTKQKL